MGAKSGQIPAKGRDNKLQGLRCFGLLRFRTSFPNILWLDSRNKPAIKLAGKNPKLPDAKIGEQEEDRKCLTKSGTER